VDLFALTAIASGLIALLFSLRPAATLCERSYTHNGLWRILRGLLLGFVAGYLVTLALFSTLQVTDAIKFASAAILAGGGLFVWIVLNLSLKTVLISQDLESKNKFASLHNALTSLPNDRMLATEFTNLDKDVNAAKLISIKIRKFQQVANALGYHRGNELLIQVANRLQNVVTEKCSLFDFGNCNFAILIRNISDENLVAEQIIRTMENPFLVQQSSVQLDCCLGFARYPDHGETVDTLLSHANMAANQARSNSLSFCEYSRELGQQLEERLEISEFLRQAIVRDELELYYQPIFAGTTGWIQSVEALVRWPQEDGSFISPEIFIPIAEQERTIHLLTQWVIENALQQLSEWIVAGLDLRMNLNLSSHDLTHRNFIQHLEQTRERWELRSSRLVLEITESAVMTDFKKARRTLNELEALGYRIAIDDFGTGYSSMSRLKDLPINHIKIDREFVMELLDNHRNTSIVSATNSIAQAFGCSVTAEGVESKEVADELVGLGCDYLQGYHLSRPLTSTAATEFLYNNRNTHTNRNNKAA